MSKAGQTGGGIRVPRQKQSCQLAKGHRAVSQAGAQDNPRYVRCCLQDTRIPAQVVLRSPSETARAAHNR